VHNFIEFYSPFMPIVCTGECLARDNFLSNNIMRLQIHAQFLVHATTYNHTTLPKSAYFRGSSAKLINVNDLHFTDELDPSINVDHIS
jgi:hypothetical protein